MSRAPRSASARRFWGDDDADTPILHLDMDAFFVSVELLERPELRGKPVAVGGATRGVVSAASYEARQFGVNSAMPVGQALKRCPHLIMIEPSHGKYSAISRRIMAILRDVTPLVEQLSVDEAFMDVSGARKLMGSPVQIAQDVRAKIRQQEGLAASVGIAATKHVAKIASAHAKPDGLLLIPQSATLEFLAGLPVGALWGVGDRTRERLENRGIETVEDLVATGEKGLVSLLGKAAGSHLYALATGNDPRPVVTTREEKSFGREETFFGQIADRQVLERVLLAQCDDTGSRLRKAGLLARSVAIKVRFSDFTTITRSVTLPQPSNLSSDFYEAARRLFRSVSVPSSGLRLLGMRVENLVDPHEGIQLSLDADERRDKAEVALDKVREKFGKNAAGLASLVRPSEPPPGNEAQG